MVTMTKSAAEIYLHGNFIAIDPSSCSSGSGLGWAKFSAGTCVASGRFTQPNLAIYDRLQNIIDFLHTLAPQDAIALEMLRSRAHTYLRWSAAVVITAFGHVPVTEITPAAWRAYAKKTHLASKARGEATDEQDAIEIGLAALRRAAGVLGSQDRPRASHVRAKRRDRGSNRITRVGRRHRRSNKS